MTERELNSAKRKPANPIKFTITLNEEQKLAKAKILTKPYNFVMGKEGSGKTLTACQIALDKLFRREIDKIVITRPAVGTEDYGFLPGSINEKMEQWMIPIHTNLRKVYNKPDKIEKCVLEGQIELAPLGFLRGQTFDRCVVIIDEVQNVTQSQLRMILGRLGKDSIMIFCGDEGQIDLPKQEQSAVTIINKLVEDKFVSKTILTANHRHEAVSHIMSILNNLK